MKYSPGKVLIFVMFVIFLVQPLYNKFFKYSVSYTVPDNVWRRITLHHKDLCGESPIQDESPDLRIIVIVYNRANSLSRLAKSLNEAFYFADRVVLDIWIDRSKDGQIDENTYRIASTFEFKHGVKIVHNQTFHVGIYGQWLNTWTPKPNSSEIVVILEDDLTVSPYFYKWLKLVHKKYDKLVEVNGYSLQGISIKHGIGSEGLLEAPFEELVFLYPVIGTWGFSPNRRNWMKFRDWFEVMLHDDKFQPLVPNILPTSWYQTFIQTGKTEGMWSMWHIYHAWKSREFTLYPNFSGQWATWNMWSDCTSTCGEGTRIRVRHCLFSDNITIANNCPEESIETENCRHLPCPATTSVPSTVLTTAPSTTTTEMDGSWSEWNGWSGCYRGQQSRSRDCNNPAPLYNGTDCQGNHVDVKHCTDVTTTPTATPHVPLVPPEIFGPTKANVGGNVTLLCLTGIPGLNVTWYYQENHRLPVGASQPMGTNELIITGVDSKNYGNYTCVLSDSYHTVKNQVFINLYETSPVILSLIKSPNTTVEGAPVKIKCDVIAFPEPVIRWGYKDPSGNPFVPPPVSYKEGGKEIDIDSFQSSLYGGIWTCSAINKLGSDHRDISL